MVNSKTATFTSVVRKVGGSCVITIPIASMKALDLHPKDYVNLKMVKLELKYDNNKPKRKAEKNVSEMDALQYMYEVG